MDKRELQEALDVVEDQAHRTLAEVERIRGLLEIPDSAPARGWYRQHLRWASLLLALALLGAAAGLLSANAALAGVALLVLIHLAPLLGAGGVYAWWRRRKAASARAADVRG